METVRRPATRRGEEAAEETLQRVAENALADYRRFLEEAAVEEGEGRLRNAAEKLYAAYKSLLAYIVARHYLPTRLPQMSREEAEWWLGRGIRVPSSKIRLVAELLAEALRDEEISDAAARALDLHDFFYYGYDPDFSRFSTELEVHRYMESLRRRLKRLEKRYAH